MSEQQEHVFDEAWLRQKKFKYAMENEVAYRPEVPIDRKVTDKFLPEFANSVSGENKNLFVLDVGCGHGYAMEQFKELGFENVQGITLHSEEYNICKEKELTVHKMNYNFSELMNGFFQIIWMRQSLQFSLQPFYTLLELNRIMRLHGWAYIEVPDTSNTHAPLGTLDATTYRRMMIAAGFEVIQHDSFELSAGDDKENHNFFVLCKRANMSLPELPEE